jgi:hypothetical protein
MRTIRTKIYKFSELTEKSQQKAIELLNDINADYSWWDCVYEDFAQFCSLIGIEVDLKKTNFTLSYSQGDGCAFTASIDLPKLIQAIEGKIWIENYSNENIQFQPVTPSIKRVVSLIQSGKIDGSAWIRQTNRETDSRLENDYAFTDIGKCANPVNVKNALDELIDLLEDVTKTLNKWFFKNLQTDLEYRISKEAIIEAINANEYEFFEDGKLIPAKYAK